MHYACMTVITIRNVPDELNERLKARASERGQSLQQFLLAGLKDVAERSPLEVRLREVLERHARPSVPAADVAAALEEARQDWEDRSARLASLVRPAQ